MNTRFRNAKSKFLATSAAVFGLLCSPLLFAQPLPAQLGPARPGTAAPDGIVINKEISIIPRLELGAAAVLSHTYRQGSPEAGNTLFDFVKDGGQDNLLPYERYTVDVLAGRRNRFTFLYQPLSPETSVVPGTAFKIDGVNFAAGKPVDILYGFDFWRGTYRFAFVENPFTRLEAGLSLQIRNANIVFTSVDGLARSAQRDVGPVPILSFRAQQKLRPGLALILEGDGFYASDALFNGVDYKFKGWIWDASIAVESTGKLGTGTRLTVRTIGGGAEGTDKTGLYTYNALATIIVSLGFSLL